MSRICKDASDQLKARTMDEKAPNPDPKLTRRQHLPLQPALSPVDDSISRSRQCTLPIRDILIPQAGRSAAAILPRRQQRERIQLELRRRALEAQRRRFPPRRRCRPFASSTSATIEPVGVQVERVFALIIVAIAVAISVRIRIGLNVGREKVRLGLERGQAAMQGWRGGSKALERRVLLWWRTRGADRRHPEAGQRQSALCRGHGGRTGFGCATTRCGHGHLGRSSHEM